VIEVPVDPQRIVAIGSPGVFLSLGAEPVAMSKLTDDDLAWRTQQQRVVYKASDTTIGAAPDLSYEKIATLRPDLIVVHVPPGAWKGNFNANRLQSIAPTVFIAIDLPTWKKQGKRVAEAIGEQDAFSQQEEAYDALVSEIQGKYGDVLGSTTFAVVNRWTATDEGSFTREYSGSYCTTHLVEAGFDISEPPDKALPFVDVSMELLGELADFDAIIYPLGADGDTLSTVVPVLKSTIWQALPAVRADHALGVSCDVTLTYESKIAGLESAKDALEKLAADE
jgi:iron complex transport system substrate-binding protein